MAAHASTHAPAKTRAAARAPGAAPVAPGAGAPSGLPERSEPAEGQNMQSYRLYISTASPISSRALVNARRFLDAALPGRYRLAVLNIADHVSAARSDQIVASPTLIRTSPLPQRRFIGDLSDVELLHRALGLRPAAAPEPGP